VLLAAEFAEYLVNAILIGIGARLAGVAVGFAAGLTGMACVTAAAIAGTVADIVGLGLPFPQLQVQNAVSRTGGEFFANWLKNK